MTVVIIPAGDGGPWHWYDWLIVVIPLVLCLLVFLWDDD